VDLLQIEKERMSLSKMVTQSSDLERQFQQAQHDLEAKVAEVQVLETQHSEMKKRLVVS